MTQKNMSPQPQALLDRWFPSGKDRDDALDTLYDIKVAQSVIQARHARSLSQLELADKLGVSQAYVSQLENASVLPSHKKLKRLARVLQTALRPPGLVVEVMPTQSYGISAGEGLVSVDSDYYVSVEAIGEVLSISTDPFDFAEEALVVKGVSVSSNNSTANNS